MDIHRGLSIFTYRYYHHRLREYVSKDVFWQDTYHSFCYYWYSVDAFVSHQHRRCDGENFSLPLRPIYSLKVPTDFMAQKATSGENPSRQLAGREAYALVCKPSMYALFDSFMILQLKNKTFFLALNF